MTASSEEINASVKRLYSKQGPIGKISHKGKSTSMPIHAGTILRWAPQ